MRSPPSRSAPGRSSRRSSSSRVAVPPLLGRRRVDHRHARAAIRAPDEQRRVRRTRRARPARRGREPVSATASLPHAPRTSTSSQRAASVAVACERLAGGERGVGSTSSLMHGSSVVEQPREGRVDRQLACERAVRSASAFAVSRPGRSDGPEQDVLGRVLEVDELDDLDVVPDGAEQLRARGVGDLGREALAQGAVAQQRRERRALELGQQLVLAARARRGSRARPPARRGRGRASVAVSQACRLTTRSTPSSAS